MTITQEKIDSKLSKVRVNLKKEDYEPSVKKQIKDLAKKVSIKGFRPGMVPVDMVKKMYGNTVLYEEIQKVLNEGLTKYISDNHIELIGSPIPAKEQKLQLDITNIRDVDFAFDMAPAPEIDLSFLETGASFPKYKIVVDEKMLNDEVDRIRNRFSTYEYPDAVGEKDVLTFTVEELDEQGLLKPGGISTVTTLSVDLLKDDAKSKVIPLKKQESLEYNVFELMDRDREAVAKNILNMNDLAKLGEVGEKFKLTLNNITRSVPAVINEDFFQKVYGEAGPKTEEEMRASIKADLDSYFDGSTDRALVNDIYKAIIEKADIPMPDEFIKRWVSFANEKSVTPEEIEKDYPAIVKSLRWSLVQRKVKKEQGIAVSEEEVTVRVRANLIHQLYGYGLKNIGQDWVEQFVQKQLADKKVVSDTREQVLEDKVLTYIKGKVKLDEKPVSIEEFTKLLALEGAN